MAVAEDRVNAPKPSAGPEWLDSRDRCMPKACYLSAWTQKPSKKLVDVCRETMLPFTPSPTLAYAHTSSHGAKCRLAVCDLDSETRVREGI